MRAVDGNAAAGRAAYLLSDACYVYPITPATGCAAVMEALGRAGVRNVRGAVPAVHQMQSELGAVAACHGAAHAGKLSATATAS